MEKHTDSKGKSLIILGFITIGILFLIYSTVTGSILTPETTDALIRIATGFYVIMLLAFGAIAYGLYKFHVKKVKENDGGIMATIAIATFNSKSRKIFLAAFVSYGIFFSLTSGTLVYQPEVTFSHHYNAVIPSAHITPCCGEPGYMPKFIVYLSEHIGLQVIPINLLLQIVVSYLVGLNVALAVITISITKKFGGLSGVGATTGLFIACPTCVGTFLALFVSASSVVTFSVILTQMQTLFIVITIPILFLTPIIMAKKLRNSDGSCKIDPTK